MAYRIVNEVEADPMRVGGKEDGSLKSRDVRSGDGVNEVGRIGDANGKKMDEDEERDAVFFRLEMLGYRVGQGLVERYDAPHSLKLVWDSAVEDKRG